MHHIRQIIGKTVATVNTNRCNRRNTAQGEPDTEILGIRFTDGSRLSFIALESDDEPYCWAKYVPPPRGSNER